VVFKANQAGAYVNEVLSGYFGLVDSPCLRIHDVFVRHLEVEPNFVSFTGNDHTRAITGVDCGTIANIREVCVWNEVDHAPNVI